MDLLPTQINYVSDQLSDQICIKYVSIIRWIMYVNFQCRMSTGDYGVTIMFLTVGTTIMCIHSKGVKNNTALLYTLYTYIHV